MKNKPITDLVNENIRFSEILVIDQNGNQLGVKSRKDALALAKEQGLDLFIVSSTGEMPVARILNYGRHKYDQKKKEKEGRKNQSPTKVKVIKLTHKIGTHDLMVKVSRAIEFLDEGMPVKVFLKFRGREVKYPEFGKKTLERFYELTKEHGYIELAPKLTDKLYEMYLKPHKKENVKDKKKEKEKKDAQNED